VYFQNKNTPTIVKEVGIFSWKHILVVSPHEIGAFDIKFGSKIPLGVEPKLSLGT
jgi:hypothetical protein